MTSLLFLAISFFLTALCYAAVGFGGGSTYTALLILVEIDYRIVPVISLVCNIMVVSIGCLTAARAQHLKLGLFWPFIISSVPMAFVGGLIAVSELVFLSLLAVSLLLAGVRLLFTTPLSPRPEKQQNLLINLLIGGGLGLLSGIVGIGGGIFLAPILYFIGWGQARLIAACCSFFILVNSLAGLAGQLLKLQSQNNITLIIDYLPLMIAVILGGVIGSFLAHKRFQNHHIQKITALLIIFVSLRLLWRIFHII